MNYNLIRWAAFFGMTAVFFGAFGAHALKQILEPEQVETFKTGVLYQFIHTIVLLVMGFSIHPRGTTFWFAAFFFSMGIILFSGSLYLLSCRQLLGIEHWTFLGPATPVGGLCFVVGWFLLSLLSKPKQNV